MFALLLACMSMIVQRSWVPPKEVTSIALLGLQGKQIQWGQIELNAGRIEGEECVALLSLQLFKVRKDCKPCVAASTLKFTDDINNVMSEDCAQRLNVTEQMSEKFWSIGYSEKGEIYQFSGERWIKKMTSVEESGDVLIFQMQ